MRKLRIGDRVVVKYPHTTVGHDKGFSGVITGEARWDKMHWYVLRDGENRKPRPRAVYKGFCQPETTPQEAVTKNEQTG